MPSNRNRHGQHHGHHRPKGSRPAPAFHCRHCPQSFTLQSALRHHQRDVHRILGAIDRPPFNYLLVDATNGPPFNSPLHSAFDNPRFNNPSVDLRGAPTSLTGPDVASFREQANPRDEEEWLPAIGSHFDRHPNMGADQLIVELQRMPAVRGNHQPDVQGPLAQGFGNTVFPQPGPSSGGHPNDAAVNLFYASIRRGVPECRLCPGPGPPYPVGGHPAPRERGPMQFRTFEELATHLDQHHLRELPRTKNRGPRRGAWEDDEYFENDDGHH